MNLNWKKAITVGAFTAASAFVLLDVLALGGSLTGLVGFAAIGAVASIGQDFIPAPKF